MIFPDEWTIRPMAAFDLDAVITIERGSKSAPHWPEGDYLALIEESVDAHLKRLVIVCASRDQVAGFAVLRLILGIETSQAELESIVVTPSLRGRGLGMMLLSEIVRQTREQGIQALTLEVRASNEAAIRMYRKADFHEIGRRKAYYSNPDEDAVLMSVTLLPATGIGAVPQFSD